MTGGCVKPKARHNITNRNIACAFFAFCSWLVAELKKLPKEPGTSVFRSTFLISFSWCGGRLSLFRLGRCRLVSVRAIGDECHGLEKVLSCEDREEKRRTSLLLKKSGWVALTQHAHIATISDTSFVVSVMVILKKFTTTLLNRSRSAGY